MKPWIKKKICLASDNCVAAHPKILEAVVRANEGCALSYGSDPWTAQTELLIHQNFHATPKVLIMPNGTGANVLSLKLSCKRHESVICTDMAHLYYQESGAPEAIVGCKLLAIPHQQGKIPVEAFKALLSRERSFGKHSTSPKVLSLTQPTEIGTVYSLEELKTLSHLCKQEKLLLHIDGSRIYNRARSSDYYWQ